MTLTRLMSAGVSWSLARFHPKVTEAALRMVSSEKRRCTAHWCEGGGGGVVLGSAAARGAPLLFHLLHLERVSPALLAHVLLLGEFLPEGCEVALLEAARGGALVYRDRVQDVQKPPSPKRKTKTYYRRNRRCDDLTRVQSREHAAPSSACVCAVCGALRWQGAAHTHAHMLYKTLVRHACNPWHGRQTSC